MNFVCLNQVFLPVKKLQETTKWYIEHFNLKNVWEGNIDQHKVVELSFTHTSFYLVEHTRLNKYSHIPFNFHTNRLNEIYENLRKKGVVVTDITSDGECFDFYDPEGNRIGFCFEANDQDESYIELGGTFLTVKDLVKATQWYRDHLEYDFEFFHASGGAGVINPTLEFIPELKIQYANVSNKSFQTKWSRLNLVETPIFYPRDYKSYSILSSNIEKDYRLLQSRNVKLSKMYELDDNKRFSFFDLDGNEIEIANRSFNI